MPETVKINEALNIIEVDSFSEVTTADLHNSLKQVIKLYEEHNICWVLCDTTAQESMPSLREYKVFIEQIPSFLSIAIVVSPSSETRDLQHTGEAFSLKSRTPYKLFYERSKAIKWLSSIRSMSQKIN